MTVVVFRVAKNLSETTSESHCGSLSPGYVTDADEFFFNLDGRLLSEKDDEWRVEVCGVHTSGTEHWIQLNLRGLVAWGLTLRTDRLDAAGVLDKVQTWLHQTLLADQPSGCTVAD